PQSLSVESPSRVDGAPVQVTMQLDDKPVQGSPQAPSLAEWRWPQLKLTELVRDASTPFELDLSIKEVGSHLSCTLKYAGDLFELETIEGIATGWKMLLQGAAKHVRRPVGRIAMLSLTERHQVLYGFNDTAVAYPHGRLVHELFEEQARLTPDAIAVVHGAQSLTYAELDARANRLARFL